VPAHLGKVLQSDHARTMRRSVAELHALLDGAGPRAGRIERIFGPALVEGIAAPG
jgi:hypothetical protein